MTRTRIDNFWGLLRGKPVATNIQARCMESAFGSSATHKWRDCGDVTHVAAAKDEAEQWTGWEDSMEIQTRDESRPEIVFTHTVIREISYRVISNRGDNHE